MTKYQELIKYSNPEKVYQNAVDYLGKDVEIAISTRKQSKYMVKNPQGKWIHFGSFNPPMEDYTKHRDKDRQQRYLKRAMGIKGNWFNNPYSPNMLSINILWM
jgi:hypothetical protein